MSPPLYCDRRIAGVERWVLGDPREVEVQVPSGLLKSVCFLAVYDGTSYSYGGTAFIVAHPSPEKRQVWGTRPSRPQLQGPNL